MKDKDEAKTHPEKFRRGYLTSVAVLLLGLFSRRCCSSGLS